MTLPTLIATPLLRPAVTASIKPAELVDYAAYPAATQRLITLALALAERHLTYRYGSANPALGGMDCSGTIYYLLGQMHVNRAPRQSNELYLWAGNSMVKVTGHDLQGT